MSQLIPIRIIFQPVFTTLGGHLTKKIMLFSENFKFIGHSVKTHRG